VRRTLFTRLVSGCANNANGAHCMCAHMRAAQCPAERYAQRAGGRETRPAWRLSAACISSSATSSRSTAACDSSCAQTLEGPWARNVEQARNTARLANTCVSCIRQDMPTRFMITSFRMAKYRLHV
jgi:hypothetical protein